MPAFRTTGTVITSARQSPQGDAAVADLAIYWTWTVQPVKVCIVHVLFCHRLCEQKVVGCGGITQPERSRSNIISSQALCTDPDKLLNVFHYLNQQAHK